MAGKNWTAGGQAPTDGIGRKNITTGGTTIRKPTTRKSTQNGNGPRKAS